MNAAATPQRPLFLTFVCVVCFLVCAFAAWMNVLQVFTDKPLRDLETGRAAASKILREVPPDYPRRRSVVFFVQNLEEALEETTRYAVPMGVASMVHVALTVVATWLMWNLRRKGFWLFVVVQIAGLAMPFIWIRATLASMLVLGIVGFLFALLGVLFALNLKHLR